MRVCGLLELQLHAKRWRVVSEAYGQKPLDTGTAAAALWDMVSTKGAQMAWFAGRAACQPRLLLLSHLQRGRNTRGFLWQAEDGRRSKTGPL